MRKLTAVPVLGSVLVAGVVAAPSFYASGRELLGSMWDHGMMGGGEGGMMSMMRG